MWRPRVVTSLQPTHGRVSWPGMLPAPTFPNVPGALPCPPPACSGIKRGQTRWAGAGVGEEEEERGVTLDLGVSSCPRPERGTALRRADPAGTA